MVNLNSYLQSYDDAAANTAMAKWLAGQPQEVWVKLAGNLNWDNAMPTMRWMVEQAECERAAAATIFWLGGDLAADDLSPEQAEDEPGCLLLMAIARRASTNGFPANLDAINDTKTMIAREDAEQWQENGISFMPGEPFPVQMLGPFGAKAAVLPANSDPTKNSLVWDLFNNLGTIFGDRPTG